MKHELCCIGHITLDKVVTPGNTVYMPGTRRYGRTDGAGHPYNRSAEPIFRVF